MPVKIRISKNEVAAKVEGAWDKGLALLSEEILGDCNKYCKEDKGMLIASSLTHSIPQEGKLIWLTPYAKRQYWEIQTAYKDRNHNATWRWCEVAKRNHKDTWGRQAQRLLEMNL